MIRRVNVFLPAALLLGLLGGCAPGHEDLRQWMTEQRSQMRPNVTPLSEPKKYVPQDYVESAAADPFGNERLTQALRRESGVKGSDASLITPELNRRKEPLEAFPLDAMSMVGSVNRKGAPYALLKVDELLYQVKVGDYLGQNYGKILAITETDITLREIVQDAAGEWIERPTTLQLQEGGR